VLPREAGATRSRAAHQSGDACGSAIDVLRFCRVTQAQNSTITESKAMEDTMLRDKMVQDTMSVVEKMKGHMMKAKELGVVKDGIFIEDGNFLDENGNAWMKDGSIVHEDGYMMSHDGEIHDKNGKEIRRSDPNHSILMKEFDKVKDIFSSNSRFNLGGDGPNSIHQSIHSSDRNSDHNPHTKDIKKELDEEISSTAHDISDKIDKLRNEARKTIHND
jgi:hypothetical protein